VENVKQSIGCNLEITICDLKPYEISAFSATLC
jgi:hypothetical protein